MPESLENSNSSIPYKRNYYFSRCWKTWWSWCSNKGLKLNYGQVWVESFYRIVKTSWQQSLTKLRQTYDKFNAWSSNTHLTGLQ